MSIFNFPSKSIFINKDNNWRNMKQENYNQPKYELCYPILISYGRDAAILYAFLKHYIKENQIPMTTDEFGEHYDVTFHRYDIFLRTGLEPGQQIDAESTIFYKYRLIEPIFINEYTVEYLVYPQDEEIITNRFYKSLPDTDYEVHTGYKRKKYLNG
jgi:hypothetical protein